MAHAILCDCAQHLISQYGGPLFGELSGGNWMILWEEFQSLRSSAYRVGDRILRSPCLENYSAPSEGSDRMGCLQPVGVQDSYLVDSASSHMLVSKIKPCMSKYKQSIL